MNGKTFGKTERKMIDARVRRALIRMRVVTNNSRRNFLMNARDKPALTFTGRQGILARSGHPSATTDWCCFDSQNHSSWQFRRSASRKRDSISAVLNVECSAAVLLTSATIRREFFGFDRSCNAVAPERCSDRGRRLRYDFACRVLESRALQVDACSL